MPHLAAADLLATLRDAKVGPQRQAYDLIVRLSDGDGRTAQRVFHPSDLTVIERDDGGIDCTFSFAAPSIEDREDRS